VLRIAPALVLLALAASCKRPTESSIPQGDAKLLSQLKAGLTEREKRIGSYRLAGAVVQDGDRQEYEFDFRAPGRLKGSLLGDKRRTFSYDGERLFDLVEESKTLTRWEIDVPQEQGRIYLTQLFAPFVPEGYRAPLVDFTQPTVKRVTHPRAVEAVELGSETKDENGAPVRVSYVYRWPSLDLVQRRLQTGQMEVIDDVDEEHCEERLKLCVPKKVTRHFGDKLGPVTTLSRVELGAPVPAESFTLAPPEGYTALSKKLSGKGG
jgi:hypothetical protein